MRRFLPPVLACGFLFAACTIEPTPAEYFDHRDPAERIRDEAAEEIRDRLLALGQALNRGDAAEAYDVLAPADDIDVVGIGGDDTREGADRIAALLERMAAPGRTRVREVEFAAGPRASVVWFSGVLDTAVAGAEPQTAYFTGIYVLTEGTWRLVQVHFSDGGDPLSRPQPNQVEARAPEGA